MKKQTWSLLLKLGGTLIILVFLFSRISFNLDDFNAILSRLDLKYFIPSLAGVIVVLGIKSYRWKRLVNAEGYGYSAWKAFGAYMAADAIGIVTPGRIGEIARLYYLRQESGISFYAAFKTVITDRVFDFTMLGWFGFSGMLFYFHVFGEQAGIFYVGIVLVAILLFFWSGRLLLVHLSAHPKIGRLHLVHFFRDVIHAATSPASVTLWIQTLVAYAAYFFFSELIMNALGVHPSYTDVAFILSLMSLSTILPISVAGFGTREASLVLLFTQYGIPAEVAISFSLLHFTAFFLLGGLVGLVFWLYMPISLQVVKDDTAQVFRLFSLDKTPKN